MGQDAALDRSRGHQTSRIGLKAWLCTSSNIIVAYVLNPTYGVSFRGLHRLLSLTVMEKLMMLGGELGFWVFGGVMALTSRVGLEEKVKDKPRFNGGLWRYLCRFMKRGLDVLV